MSKVSQSEVVTAVEKVLEMNTGVLSETSRAEDIEGWDSIGQLSILVELDTLFDGKVANIEEMASADSMPKILDILKQNLLL
jgi:hypothetical protein